MGDYLYDASGNAVEFVQDRFIYRLDGTPIGQLSGSTVYDLTGQHVGELQDDIVVDTGLRRGNLGAVSPPHPGARGSPGNRGARGCADAFLRLTP